MSHTLKFASCLLLCGFTLGAARADQPRSADELRKQVYLKQKLNAQIPLDLTFHDETGKTVRLHEYFGRKPVMLNLIQYRCTMLCSTEMKVLAASLKQMEFDVAKQFDIITLSIDARETAELAAAYKKGYVEEYGRAGAATGWHFLTGDETSIRRLADAIGYHFAYDPRTNQFMHPDGLIIATPEGKIARYFFRLVYPPRDMRWALIEAAKERIGSPLDAVALICYHYDPVTGKYNLEVMGVLRLAALATVLLLGVGVTTLSLRDRRARRPAEGKDEG
jgi:protein SCO1